MGCGNCYVQPYSFSKPDITKILPYTASELPSDTYQRQIVQQSPQAKDNVSIASLVQYDMPINYNYMIGDDNAQANKNVTLNVRNFDQWFYDLKHS